MFVRTFRAAVVTACVVFALGLPSVSADPLGWSELKPLPDDVGFAGPFAGVSGGALIVAGGANFPEGYPWDGGTKIYHDRIFVLTDPGGEWQLAEQKLPRTVAYGVSVAVPSRDAVVCIGGNNAEQTFADVFELGYGDGVVSVKALPSLPVRSTMGAGLAIGGSVYFAGGEVGGTTHQKFFKLDLSAEKPAWEELPWPAGAAGRILSVAGAHGDEFFLFGGADLGSDRWDKRSYLSDAWAFDTVAARWRRLADLPGHATAGPSPALPSGYSHLLLLGGASRDFVDSQHAARPDTNGAGVEHPGFPKRVLAYHTITNTWMEAGTMPADTHAPVTVPTVLWKGRYVVPSGEVKPGIRSPQVLVAEAVAQKRSFGIVNWIIVIVYLGTMVLIGCRFSKRNNSTDDYFRGGQRIPWVVAGLSIFATMLSAITFMAIPARAYETDVSWYIGQLPILIVVPLVVMFYLPHFRRLDITSAYEFLEHRFNLAARLFASLSFILFHIGRVAIVLYLPAIALAQVSSVDVVTCIAIIGVLCVIYTVMGGIEAVVWTDAVQAVVLIGGALLCLVMVFSGIEGGLSGVWRTAVEDKKLFQSLGGGFDIGDGTTSFIVLFIAFFFNVLVPYSSGQDVVQRYVTTPTEKEARRSLWTTMWMSIFGSIIFFALGVALYAFYKASPGSLDPAMTNNDGILPFFIFGQLPVGVAGLLIAAIFAAAQSTVSSSLNSVATAYVTDFHARVFRPGSDDKQRLKVARMVVVMLGIVGIAVAVVMAKSEMASAFKVFNSLIGLTAGSLGGLFALGVFNRRASGTGAVVGAVVAFATVILLYVTKAPVTGLLYATIGFAICFVVGSLVSLFAPRAAAEG